MTEPSTPAVGTTSARAELLARVEFVEATLDSLDEGIVACDAEGTLVLFNDASRRLHGLPEQELPPERWAAHYDLLDAEGERHLELDEIPLLRALRGELVRDVPIVVAPGSGAPRRDLLVTGRQVRADDGSLLGAVVAMRDVTSERAAATEARRQRETAEALRTELMAAVSHDMRSPLSSILGFTETLELHADGVVDSDRLADVVHAVRRQALALEDLVGQFLDYTRMSGAEPLPIAREPVDLVTVARAAVDAHAYSGRLTLRSDDPVTVTGDRSRLARVVSNLVVNALRHGDGEVVVTVAANGTQGRLVVRDHGNGLGPEPEALFGQYVRADDAAGTPGSGLGLHVSRGIARAHGGTLVGRDAPGGGAQFELCLPLAGGG